MDLLVAKVFLQTAVLRGRSAWLIFFVAIDFVIAFATLTKMGTDGAFRSVTRDLVLGFILPITAMLMGTAVIREEVERGTLGYWLTRPVSRLRFAAIRLATASLCVAAVVCGVFFGNSLLLSGDNLDAGLLAVLLGSFAYTAFFSMLGVLLKRPFIVGSIAILLIDYPVSQLPMSARFFTIRAHVENVSGLQLDFGKQLMQLLSPLDVTTSIAALVGITVVGGWLTTQIFRRMEFTGSDG
jgi:ABC-type transport system involved in multi-copper enzyme maturation permease subunit